MRQDKPTLAGICAIALWAIAALLLTHTAGVPTLLVAAIASLIGFAGFAILRRIQGGAITGSVCASWKGVLFAAFGIGCYRLLYFASFNFAPAVEVSLINYLWPVLIIVFTGCLSREHVRWNHLAGAALGLLGISVLMLREGQATWTFSQGHLLALLAAVEWAGFSVMNRRLKHYSSDVVPMSFLVTGAVFLALHFCFEPGPLRIGLEAAVSITVLGLSSVFAYYLWDVGMKHGNIQVLGALSYITPLASTLMLMLFAKTEPSPVILASAVLVALGGKLAAKKA